MIGKHKKAKITDEWVISEFSSVQSDEEQERADQNHMCARYERALDSFLSPPATPLTSAPSDAVPPSNVGPVSSIEDPHDSENSEEPECSQEPDLLFVFARKKQSLLDSEAVTDGRPTPRSRPRPPWLQWTLVAQLALPPRTLQAAMRDAETAADAAGEAAAAAPAAGADISAVISNAASSPAAAAAAAAAAATSADSLNSQETTIQHWFASQKMDEHVQKWLMHRLPKRAWSDVAQCVAWYRPDLVFTRHPAFEMRFEPQKPFFQRLFPESFPSLEPHPQSQPLQPVQSIQSQSQSQSQTQSLQSHVLVSNLKRVLGLLPSATRAAMRAAYEAATWRQQASILRHVAGLQLSADWDVLGLSASTGGIDVTGIAGQTDGDTSEDDWGEQVQGGEVGEEGEEEEEEEEGKGEEGEGRDLQDEEGEEEDEDLVWSEAEEQRALARDAEIMKQGQGLMRLELMGAGSIDGDGGAADIDLTSAGAGELSIMEQTLVRKKEEAGVEVKAAVGPFDSARLVGELTLLHAIETGEVTF
ncbi:hypothetical protein CLOP_g10105 [Closterium sp. NIES-67]|nr:hypothetical protein CLOP_g10105 [Closterium sp. NIES-67]